MGYDALVINDGSKDDTDREVLKAGIDILNLPCNLGYGAAVETGFRYAIKNILNMLPEQPDRGAD